MRTKTLFGRIIKTKIYIGVTPDTMQIFRSDIEPTFSSHGVFYNAVIGPFKTLRGARFMRQYGKGNPHLQDVNDAERIAKQYSKVGA